jgi:hypothetical protein
VKTTRNDIAQDASAGYARQYRARTTASFQHPANARCGRCACGSQQRIARSGRGFSGRGHVDGRVRIRVGPLTGRHRTSRYRAKAQGTQSRRRGRTARTHVNLRRSRANPSLAKQVARQLMVHDAIGAHARDELGISEFSARIRVRLRRPWLGASLLEQPSLSLSLRWRRRGS